MNIRKQRLGSAAIVRLLVAAAFFAVPVAQSRTASAGDIPTFRRGIWEFTRTMVSAGGQKQAFKNRRCSSPSEDIEQLNAAIVKAGCSLTPMIRNGAAYVSTTQCNVHGIHAQSRNVISIDSDSAYRADVETQGGPVAREVLVARRIGDCR